MTNELVYTAYRVELIPSERMLLKLPTFIKEQFKKDKVETVGIKMKTVELNKEKGASAVVVVAYFPKYREEKDAANEMFKGKIEQSVKKASLAVGAEFKSLGELPIKCLGTIAINYADYETDKQYTSDRYVIELSRDISNRFASKLTRAVDNYLDKINIPVFSSYDVGGVLYLYAQFPKEILESRVYEVNEALEKWERDLRKKLRSEEIAEGVRGVYKEVRKETEMIIKRKNEERNRYTEITVSIDEPPQRAKIEMKRIQTHLLNDYYSRIKDTRIEEVGGKKLLRVQVVHPYTTHRTDNVAREFEKQAISLVKDKLVECTESECLVYGKYEE